LRGSQLLAASVNGDVVEVAGGVHGYSCRPIGRQVQGDSTHGTR
jgi:hypothetical protein